MRRAGHLKAKRKVSGRSSRIAAAGAAGLNPLMQKPGGDHREVGERPSRRAILNPSGNP